MLKNSLQKILFYLFIVVLIFFLDRFSKIYILNLAELNNSVDIYLSSFLNLYLIWNKGIAFGLLSFEQNLIYNLITLLISVINIFIICLIIKTKDIRVYFLIFILGGSLGNLFDRVYYTSVPDFIDFHIGNFHWFIFNVADIFITLGIVCLILAEIFLNKKDKNEVK